MRVMQTQAERGLTGWHVLAMFVTGFSIIIAVNITLAINAVRTFPGKETESSYVASQHFDSDRAAQEARIGVIGGKALHPKPLRVRESVVQENP